VERRNQRRFFTPKLLRLTKNVSIHPDINLHQTQKTRLSVGHKNNYLRLEETLRIGSRKNNTSEGMPEAKRVEWHEVQNLQN
jgi:hypothetical protein